VAAFGAEVKRASPGSQFWICLLDTNFDIPGNVDTVVLDWLDCATPQEVQRRGEKVLPGQLAKAAPRPVVINWDCWEGKGSGLVPKCQPGTPREFGKIARKQRLAGLIFSSYASEKHLGRDFVGLQTRPELVTEIKDIARDGGVTGGKSLLGRQAGAAVPSAKLEPAQTKNAQLDEYESLKYGMFIHFGIGTFMGGKERIGRVSPTKYAPSDLDVRQWVRVARQAGMKYAVLTACHAWGGGFCLWPADSDPYNVAQSGWPVDVVAQFLAACKAEDIKPGLYYSLAKHRDFPALLGQLDELLRKYPGLYLMWLDTYRSVDSAQWREVYDFIKRRDPHCLVTRNRGRRDDGNILESEWPTDILGLESPRMSTKPHQPRQTYGGRAYYLPGEWTYPVLDGETWMWNEQARPQSTETLWGLYRRCRQCGCNVLLNVSPDRFGRIPNEQVQRLMELKAVIDGGGGLPKS
jgi:alpha-L-fucosidase